MKLRVAFAMEQQVGHRTYYENLKHFIEQDGAIEAMWLPITYYAPHGLIERLPLPAQVRGTLRGRQQVRRGLAHSKPDVAFFNTQVAAVLAGGLAQRQPYVCSTDLTPHQYDRMARLYGHHVDRVKLLADYKHRTTVRVLRQAARLLPWSTFVRQSLIDEYGVSLDRIEVLPPGVDVEVWRPDPAARSAHNPIKILFVGGDFNRKGGPVLQAAFQALRVGSAELHLVTRSPAPHGAGICTHHDLQPNQPELIELFQQSDVFVLPTEAEAFGIAALEASATGLPLIATQVGGLNDIVVEGETGYLIKPGDVSTLTDRLRRLCGDAPLRDRMGQAARARAVTRFDARKNAQRVAELLIRVAGEAR